MQAQSSEHPPRALVRAVETRLDGLAGAKWRPLSGGRTNFAWRLDPAGGRAPLVVKLYRGPARNPLFPNDPRAEALLLRRLGPSGLTPRLVSELRTEPGICNIYTHIPGSPWTTGAGIAGALVRSLHRIAPPSRLRRVPDGSAALEAQTRRILADCRQPDHLSALVPGRAVAACDAAVLLHGDIVPGNLIGNATGLHLIDWQCPARGDPCEDIAMFLSPAMQSVYRGQPLTEAEIGDFFAAYGAPEVAGRYARLAPWYHWRMAAYCQWQSENGRPDYGPARDLEVAALQRSLSA
ncbi:phosphotransferase [Shimia sp.]|uniref:phosphotransferase n=1 Tax=Shimia sp. TaxID=1954381 RepID=UPI0035620976